MPDKPVTSASKSAAAPAAGAGGPVRVHFPDELRRHFYDVSDWPVIIFVSVSLAVSLLTIGIAASLEWRDPAADLTNEQLIAMQANVLARVRMAVEAPPPEESLLSEVTNPEFEATLQKQQESLAASLQSTLAEAQKTLADLDKAVSASAATEAAGAQSSMADLLSSLGDIGNLGAAADVSGPALDLAPTDVAIFAEGAGGSRVVSGAIDIAALGPGAQISSQFTKGGMSQSEAARLTQQIQFARERLGGNVQLRVGSGLGGNRRLALRVASGGKTGQRIQLEQLALPPARAAGPGGRDQDAVDAQAARTRNFIGGCYTIGLAADPSLSGLVVVRFTIQPNGAVTNVQVSKSNLGNRDVESCIVAVVQGWKFSASSSTDTFEYPFTFEPG